MMDEILQKLYAIEQEIAIVKVKLTEVEKTQDEFQSGVNRGLWLIGGGFIAAIVSFIIKGGLNGQ